MAARSKYFKTCLSQVGTKESIDGIIEITDFPPKIIENLLEYIYTNEIAKDLITMDFLMAVDKYNLGGDLLEICIEHLKSNITIHNVVEIMARSYQIDCVDLKNAAFEFMNNNHGKIVFNEKWINTYFQAMSSIHFDPKSF